MQIPGQLMRGKKKKIRVHMLNSHNMLMQKIEREIISHGFHLFILTGIFTDLKRFHIFNARDIINTYPQTFFEVLV